jgi:uncharacterized protein (UPF0261 family)
MRSKSREKKPFNQGFSRTKERPVCKETTEENEKEATAVTTKKAYVVGTCDTKYEDLAYVRDLIAAQGVQTLLVDVGIRAPQGKPDVTNREVAAFSPTDPNFLDTADDRGRAVADMAAAFAAFLASRTDVGGVLGLGGSGGTSLVCTGMRTLPIGVPKMMVSTVASSNVAPYVGPNDICMLYSVTDVAGINRISRVVLANAAHALAGMIRNPVPEGQDRPAVGMTMFGVTTPCVDMVRKALETEHDCLVFHATGTGGQSMEKLADSGLLAGVLDITTTEVCDLLMGGVFPCTEDRFGAVIRTRTPYVGSVGALDMVNFGARDTVPERYRDRLFHVHNPQVTLMRTTPEENRRMGEWIAERLNRMEGPVRFLLPEKGVSMIDTPGLPFYDSEADAALFETLKANVVQTPSRRLVSLSHNVNDPEFAAALVAAFREIA